MHFHYEEVVTLFSTGAIIHLVSFGLNTFPKPQNKYALWLLGIIQFVFLNKDLARVNFDAAAAEVAKEGEK